MNENMKVIRDLMVDIDSASKGMSTKFSQDALEATLRAEIVKVFGKENPSLIEVKRNPNSGAFFEVMEEFIGNAGTAALQLAIPFAEFKSIGWGDENRFEIENADLFDVITLAKGNANIRRQRLENGYMSIPTEAKGIKIFENFKRFLSGRVNWVAMVQKVTASYVKHVQELVYTAFYASTPVNSNAKFNVNEAGALDKDNVYEMVEHVQAENQNSDVIIMGTRLALKALTPVIVTEEANKQMHELGYYKTAEGYSLVVVDQMHVANTYEFLLSNKQFMVIPADLGGLVKIMEEGTPLIIDTPIGKNADMSVEHMFYREVGVGIVTGRAYGKYTWTN